MTTPPPSMEEQGDVYLLPRLVSLAGWLIITQYTYYQPQPYYYNTDPLPSPYLPNYLPTYRHPTYLTSLHTCPYLYPFPSLTNPFSTPSLSSPPSLPSLQWFPGLNNYSPMASTLSHHDNVGLLPRHVVTYVRLWGPWL